MVHYFSQICYEESLDKSEISESLEKVSVYNFFWVSESLSLLKSKITVSEKSRSHYFRKFAVLKSLGLEETKKLSLEKVSVLTISIE